MWIEAANANCQYCNLISYFDEVVKGFLRLCQRDVWWQCSVTCGRGRQTRRVFCLERRGTDWIEQDDIKCRDVGDVRPSDQQDCVAADDCGRVWLIGPFGQVWFLVNKLAILVLELRIWTISRAIDLLVWKYGFLHIMQRVFDVPKSS